MASTLIITIQIYIGSDILFHKTYAMAPSFDNKFDFLTALTLSKDGAAFVWIAAYLGGDRLLSQG